MKYTVIFNCPKCKNDEFSSLSNKGVFYCKFCFYIPNDDDIDSYARVFKIHRDDLYFYDNKRVIFNKNSRFSKC